MDKLISALNLKPSSLAGELVNLKAYQKRLGQPIMVLDLETTEGSVNHKNFGIMQWGMVLVSSEGIWEGGRLCYPENPIGFYAEQITGIKQSDVAGKGVLGIDAAALSALMEQSVISGYQSNSFDVPGLVGQISRYSGPLPKQLRLLDAKKMWNLYLGASEGKLQQACEHFGFNFDAGQAHDALYDAKQTALLLNALLPEIGLTTINQYHEYFIEIQDKEKHLFRLPDSEKKQTHQREFASMYELLKKVGPEKFFNHSGFLMPRGTILGAGAQKLRRQAGSESNENQAGSGKVSLRSKENNTKIYEDLKSELLALSSSPVFLAVDGIERCQMLIKRVLENNPQSNEVSVSYKLSEQIRDNPNVYELLKDQKAQHWLHEHMMDYCVSEVQKSGKVLLKPLLSTAQKMAGAPALDYVQLHLFLKSALGHISKSSVAKPPKDTKDQETRAKKAKL